MWKRFLLVPSLCVLLAPAGARQAPEFSFDGAALQTLLQRFVDEQYGRGFRHLGDERDFDHVHLLAPAGAGHPVALLYHTQELADDAPAGSGFGPVNPGGRNWLQWTANGFVENASAYRRSDYPGTPSWDLFRARDLPGYVRRRTIVEGMLDPKRLGFTPAPSQQWTFTKTSCSSPESHLSIRLPPGERVCLSLGIL